MNTAKLLLGSVLLTLSLNTLADSSTPVDAIQPAAAGPAAISLDILKVAPCKTNGDGTYVEMITTMASVLPPEIGDALLARYCEECFKRKFQVTQKR
jgi:hypothetical protein